MGISVVSLSLSDWTKGENRLLFGACPPGNPGAEPGVAIAKGEPLLTFAPTPGAAAAGPLGINAAILCGGMGAVRLSSGEMGAENSAGHTR